MNIKDILKSPWTTHVGVGVVAAGAGIGIGYYLWGREPEYEVVVPADEDDQLKFDFDTRGLAEAKNIISRESYNTEYVPTEHNPVRQIPETTAEIVDDMVIIRAPGKPEPEIVEVNVFESEDPEWNWEEELANRDEKKPYILHRDEFYQNERNYSQMSLTYYKGDDMMADEESDPVFDYRRITGPLRFGHGSGETTMVFVRNVDRRAEYEIIFDEGRFEVEVLGLEYEEQEAEQDLKHSKINKFRMD